MRSAAEYDALFTPEEPLHTHHIRLSPELRIEVSDVKTMIGSTQLRKGCVSGVVVKNPFFRTNRLKASEVLKEEELLAFAEPEYLVCRLDHWLDKGDEVDYYVLTELESVRLGEAVLLHPRCTWGNLRKRGRPIERDGFGKVESEWKRREGMLERVKLASKRKVQAK